MASSRPAPIGAVRRSLIPNEPYVGFQCAQVSEIIRLSDTTGAAEAAIVSNKHVATAGSMGTLHSFIARYPIWAIAILVLIVALAWLIVAPWPPGLEEAMGRKRVFLNAILSGITLGALYFLVASGFTLVFGLMRNVNLAHGSLYLLGGYIGYGVADVTGYWLLAFPVVFILVGALGLLLQHQVFRHMEGEELRQTMVTIGISIVLADLMLWFWGGQSYQLLSPDWLSGPTTLPLVSSIRPNGEAVYLSYPPLNSTARLELPTPPAHEIR